MVKKKDEEVSGEKISKKIVKKTSENVVKISDLPGIGPATIEKLESAGIFDLMGVAVLSPKELGEMAGLGESVARKAIQASRKMMDLGFQDGLEFAKKREEARQNKNWEESDKIRDQIKTLGYVIEDSSSGFRLKKI